MAEIRNVTRNGETFYPLTCTDAVVDRDGNPLEIVNDIFDISEYNASGTPPVLAKYSTLALALAAVPQSKQKGGMTIRYVQTSDNKYVQYRLMSNEWSANTDDWSFCGNDILIENPEYAKIVRDKVGTLVFMIKKDGSIDWAVGVPGPVKDYVSAKISGILKGSEDTDIDGLNKIFDFLDGISTSDTLSELLSEKVDKETGKSLIDSGYAAGVHCVDDPEWAYLITDSLNKLIEGIKKNGIKKFFEGIEVDNFASLPGMQFFLEENPEFKWVVLDKYRKVIIGVKQNGDVVVSVMSLYDKVIAQIDEVEQEFEKLETYEEPLYLPDYYNQNNYLENKAKVISDEIRKCAVNGDCFFFVTDTHWDMNEKHSPAIIKQINKELNIQKVFHGGDMFQERYAYGTNKEYWYQVSCVNAFRQAMNNNHVYLSDGNHEFIFSAFTWDDVFAEARLFLNDVVFGGVHKNYYYFDNTQQKIRYIFLASYGEYSGGVIYNGYTDTEQVSWLEDVALNTDEGYDVVVVAHHILSAAQWPAQDNPAMEYNLAGFQTNIAPLLEAYNQQEGKKVIACICGHSHRDCVDVATYSFPVIVCTCDNNRILDKFSPARTQGTIDEQAIDATIIDKDSRIVTLVRLGCPANDMIYGDWSNYEFVEARTVYYTPLSVGNSLTLNTYLSGSITWSVSDNTIASVNGGVVTALSSGGVRVNATDVSGNIHSFYIKIINQ